MVKNTYKELVEPSLIYGLIIGFVSLLFSVVMQVMNASFSSTASFAGIIISIGLYAYCLFSYRKEYHGGFMSYSRGVGMGALFSVVSAIIGTAYLIVLIKYIDPGYLEMARKVAEEKLLEKGLPDESIEQMMEMSDRFRTLGFMAITGFFGSIIMGTVFSVIIMIFLKKEPKDPFASVEAQ
jgi:tetrahydromethanopterin S-methyltransferase subunit F